MFYLFILLIKIRATNRRTILGKIYLDNIYRIITTKVKLKATWLTK
jgi:hypothetical protein